MRPLALVAAMQEELAAVLASVAGARLQRIAGRDFVHGQLHGRPVVAVLSRIGKVAAAATATVLAERFDPEAVVFTGVAGGVAPGVQVGDVVVADAFLQHDLDVSPLFPRYEIPLLGLDRLPTDPGWTGRLVAAAAAALPGTPVHRGLVVTGDRFVSTTPECRALQAALPRALAVEMEGAAIAQVCHDYGLPFAAVRTISDRADDAAHGDFQRFVREVASRHSAAIVRALLA